jgi:hypothetical protein
VNSRDDAKDGRGPAKFSRGITLTIPSALSPTTPTSPEEQEMSDNHSDS